MKRFNGPTKKLAPSSAPDSCCPHSFTDDDGIQLEVDCSDCPGAHDLQNRKCLTGIVNVMCFCAEPDVIILKRFIHRRYRGDVVTRAALAASELAALRRGLNSVDSPSDKKCRTCSASAEKTIMNLKRKLLESPSRYVEYPDDVFKELEESAQSHSCSSARACAAKGFSFSILRRSR